MKRRSFTYTTIFLILFLTVGWLCRAGSHKEKGYVPVVVLDPGHGGRDITPYSIYGDKYDITSHRYLDHFREGANHKGIWENEAMYEISSRVTEILALTLDESKHKEFKELMSPFGEISDDVRPLKPALSRQNSYFSQYPKNSEDINAPYRLYDYPDIKTSEMQKGTISRINELNPDLVVTVHLTKAGAPKTGGLAAVITPSYKTYNQARKYVTSGKSVRNQLRSSFLKGPYSGWFIAAWGYDRFQSFLCDSWIYFTGNWSKPNGLALKDDKFRGYRQHMISWSYADEPGWEKKARENPRGTQFASHLQDFKPVGKFWEREQGEPEQWRREGGPEGKGGDNFYAAQEILRFIRSGFKNMKDVPDSGLPKLMPPYISTWAVPTYVNAISAYLEINHLASNIDYTRMKNEREVYARSIAAGIYSLFYSFDKLKNKNSADFPRAEKIDFQRYRNHPNGNYFKKPTQ